jgi:hypothetical protein
MMNPLSSEKSPPKNAKTAQDSIGQPFSAFCVCFRGNPAGRQPSRGFHFIHRVLAAGAFSPAAFVVRAFTIALLYAVSELRGLREYTTFLSGTSANLNMTWQTASVLGLIHLVLYVAFILLVPILLITAGLLAAGNLWIGRARVEQELHGREARNTSA